MIDPNKNQAYYGIHLTIPPPTQVEQIMITSSISFLSEKFVAFVDDTLMQYAHEESDAILSISDLDGFLTAIASGPLMIMPSQWMPEIWGGEQYQPNWESENQLKQFMACVFEMMNSNTDYLTEHPENFQAIFLESIRENKTYTIVDDWCEGYVKAVKLDSLGWLSAPKLIQEQLAHIGVFAYEEHYDMLAQLSDDGIEKLQANIEPAVRKIHAYFLKQRAIEMTLPKNQPNTNQQVVRSDTKIGRNDPCICASGKKFKKCCLKPLRLVT